MAEMQSAIAAEYTRVIQDAATAAPSATRRSLARLRAELRRICQRDYFPPPEGDEARRAIEDLGALVVQP